MDTETPLDLETVYAPIQAEMAELQRFLQREFVSTEPLIWEILQHVARFRGKQMRPALLFLAARLAPAGRPAFGETPERDAVKIGAVIELIHTATLIHDDVLDDARLRRRVETVHHRWGERAAVLIGDFIYSRAFHLSTQVPGMAELLSDTTHTVCEGELLQIATRHRPITEETYFEIIRKKTAILYAVACRIGAQMAGLNEAACAKMYNFGMELGIAFQIVDDCLDYTGRESVTGKSLGTDLRQGKVTLPLICLLDGLSQDDRRTALQVVRDPSASKREGWLHELVLQRGAALDAFARAELLVRSGKALLSEAFAGNGVAAGVCESLVMVADHVVRRNA